MDPLIRGLIEQHIDKSIEEKTLKNSYKLFKFFKDEGLIDSIESALLSHIYTRAVIFFRILHVEIDKEHEIVDTKEFLDLFMSRAHIIRTQIRKIYNL